MSNLFSDMSVFSSDYTWLLYHPCEAYSFFMRFLHMWRGSLHSYWSWGAMIGLLIGIAISLIVSIAPNYIKGEEVMYLLFFWMPVYPLGFWVDAIDDDALRNIAGLTVVIVGYGLIGTAIGWLYGKMHRRNARSI